MLKKKIPKANVLIATLCIISVLGIIGCVSPTIFYTGQWVEVEHPPGSGTMKKVCMEGGRDCVVAGDFAVDIPDYIADLLE